LKAAQVRPLKWLPAPEVNHRQALELAGALDISPTIARVLISRGFTTPDAARAFLHPNLSDLKDPFTLLGMDKAVSRLIDALYANERILVFGDYDVDGITATSVMCLVLNRLGAQISYYLPSRLDEGYGLSEDGIDTARERGCTLIITVDCGITAVEEVIYAREHGIDVIITDHHEAGEPLPDAAAIVDPKQQDCMYEGGEIAGVGVAFKLCQALYMRLEQDPAVLEEHLDLVAMGTAADIVPLLGENRILVKYGLAQIARTDKPGLKALIFVSGLMGREMGTGQVVFVIAPRINAVGRLGDAEKAIRLLTTRDEALASDIARVLDSENKRRKDIDEATLAEALEQIERTVDLSKDKAIVLSREGWHQGVIGIVASRIVERFHRPTVMISVEDGVGKGSARSISSFHLYDALSVCSDHLLRFGGHKYAAGLSIDPAQIDGFREMLKRVAAERLTDEDLVSSLTIDADIDIDEIDEHFVDLVEMFAPYGPQNPRPTYRTTGVEIIGRPYIVGRNHLKFKVRGHNRVFDVIGFGMGDRITELQERPFAVNLAYVVEHNTYNGRTRIQLRLRDLKVI
jgi:single-stranded-DNA-specific exonuclease